MPASCRPSPRLVGGAHAASRGSSSSPAASTGRSSPRGLACWQRHDGNYWGHNAIIRTRAFADCCGLPELPGKPPFGGHILSHDFVEAALDAPRRLGGADAPTTSTAATRRPADR